MHSQENADSKNGIAFLGDQPLKTYAWTDRQTHLHIYIYIYISRYI